MSMYDYDGDAQRAMDVVTDGGIAIIPSSVGYVILGATTDAINPNKNANSLALIHMIALGVVAGISGIYIASTGNALVNGAKLGSNNYTKVNIA